MRNFMPCMSGLRILLRVFCGRNGIIRNFQFRKFLPVKKNAKQLYG